MVLTYLSVETSVIGTERELRRSLRNRKENHRYATLLSWGWREGRHEAKCSLLHG